ncbi:unnamed protein product [Notodromas monacha]|uniref:Death-associated protein 1 n=1 Tax=Notodromas monacha TaxID=399045 RepID=A0A7R9GAJ8_9CRUS|nr:unnamed protein product [Notodromas monacha]CAG0914075.1 unnamed protein product [Notodromas monacha]
MSSEQPILKGGHLPAVKAGGMRITQHKPPKEDKPKESRSSDDEEFPAGSPPKPSPLVISGAVVKGDADFPPEAIQKFHNKPEPSHDDRRNSGAYKSIIHQPRK